jgi:hypothetical protein
MRKIKRFKGMIGGGVRGDVFLSGSLGFFVPSVYLQQAAFYTERTLIYL